jgi:hypothetical protein
LMPKRMIRVTPLMRWKSQMNIRPPVWFQEV